MSYLWPVKLTWDKYHHAIQAVSSGRDFLKLYNGQKKLRQKRFRSFQAISIILKENCKNHFFYNSVESMADSDWSPSSDPHQDSNQDCLGFGKSARLFHSHCAN